MANGTAHSGTRVAVSIRPQSIVVEPRGSNGASHAGDGLNVADGRVVRHVYLGESRDYQIGVTGTDVVLRVATAARQALPPGEPVRLTIDPEVCSVIAD